MDRHTVFLLFGLLIHTELVESIWRCSQNEDCVSLAGSVCDVTSGQCVCTAGQQPVLGGTACVDVAPYLTSPCAEDHQCARLFTGFECRISNETANEGNCFCRSGFHYLRGRCWRSSDFGGTCTRDEECMGTIRLPFSMSCRGTCQCAEGFYERQRGHCREASYEIGDGCVLNEDCRFPGGACDLSTLRCISATNATDSLSFEGPIKKLEMSPFSTSISRVECNATSPCESPFECSTFGVCICPLGYYSSPDGQRCLAELGSPSDITQCAGFQALVREGICACQANFFYDENMRDCIRATRRISDSCVNDYNCHTFGPASRCGLPQDPWGFRSCECEPELSVWDPQQTMCRFFSGVGGACESDSDCQAGELEIQCVRNELGEGVCTCPAHLIEHEGLCLTSGLGLGERCQHTLECNGTANSECSATSQLCVCADGYQAVDGICAPIIGGTCTQDSDCVIENTVCRYSPTGSTCQCRESFLAYNDVCWPEVDGFNATCSVTPQCTTALGNSSSCINNRCSCANNFHYRDGNCWPVTRLMESCSRITQCYLPGLSERVVCRNGLCQCDFHYPLSEDMQTCLSSATITISPSTIVVLISTVNIFFFSLR